MYRISKIQRKYSPTPIVRVTTVDGREQEELVLLAIGMKKAEGDALSKKIVHLLNTYDKPLFT